MLNRLAPNAETSFVIFAQSFAQKRISRFCAHNASTEVPMLLCTPCASPALGEARCTGLPYGQRFCTNFEPYSLPKGCHEWPTIPTIQTVCLFFNRRVDSLGSVFSLQLFKNCFLLSSESACHPCPAGVGGRCDKGAPPFLRRQSTRRVGLVVACSTRPKNMSIIRMRSSLVVPPNFQSS